MLMLSVFVLIKCKVVKIQSERVAEFSGKKRLTKIKLFFSFLKLFKLAKLRHVRVGCYVPQKLPQNNLLYCGFCGQNIVYIQFCQCSCQLSVCQLSALKLFKLDLSQYQVQSFSFSIIIFRKNTADNSAQDPILQMNSSSSVSRDDLLECVISRRQGSENLQTAVVPMWVVYQFLVSVVLLRILIVMMTITYKKIYDNLDTQWK